MSDMGVSLQEGVEAVPAHSDALTAGMMIRNAREVSGLHVAALAVAMKIPVKKLEALEADRLDLLHDPVFVRALAASVCRALKIDPAPVLQKLPLNTVPRLSAAERGINAPFHTPGGSVGSSIPLLLSRPSALIVIALLVGGIAVAFFPDIKVSDWAHDLSPSSLKSATESGAPVPTTTEAVEVVSAPVTAVPIAASTPLSTGSAILGTASPSTPSVSSSEVKSTSPVAPAPAASVSVVAPVVAPSSLVVFKAKGLSWIKVVDAKGTVQLNKTLAPGEVAGTSGTMPLSITIGRVDVTDVEVRGKPFDLSGVAKENVARFEVK